MLHSESGLERIGNNIVIAEEVSANEANLLRDGNVIRESEHEVDGGEDDVDELIYLRIIR